MNELRGIIQHDSCRSPRYRQDQEEEARGARFLAEFSPLLSGEHVGAE